MWLMIEEWGGGRWEMDEWKDGWRRMGKERGKEREREREGKKMCFFSFFSLPTHFRLCVARCSLVPNSPRCVHTNKPPTFSFLSLRPQGHGHCPRRVSVPRSGRVDPWPLSVLLVSLRFLGQFISHLQLSSCSWGHPSPKVFQGWRGGDWAGLGWAGF